MSSYLAECLERCFYVYFLLILLSERNHLNKLVSHLVVCSHNILLSTQIQRNIIVFDYIHANKTTQQFANHKIPKQLKTKVISNKVVSINASHENRD